MNNPDESIAIFARNFVELTNQNVKRVPEGEKRNPNSLRFLIAHIIAMYFDSNRKVAAAAMKKRTGMYRSERADRNLKRMNYDALSEILRDEKHIAYWQLEEISGTIGIPVGALLLFSRLYSLLQDKNNLEFELVNAVKILAQVLEKVSNEKSFSKADFDLLAKAFYKVQNTQKAFPFGPAQKDDG